VSNFRKKMMEEEKAQDDDEPERRISYGLLPKPEMKEERS